MQREINQRQGVTCGAQQAMPKPEDERLFGPQNPLPWVLDLVGTQFGSSNGVLVVGSSYNGFIRGYSARTRKMDLQTYIDCRDDEAAGQQRFVGKYVSSVVEGDEDYYQPILRNLLGSAGVPPKHVCLTDLCKASFVKRGNGGRDGCRGDTGNDGVVRQSWANWTDYVCWPPDDLPSERVSYRWIWQRVLHCRIILALGSIAEYGILKIFLELADRSKVCSQRDSMVQPNKSLFSGSSWKYGYACRSRRLRDWLELDDWWKLEATENGEIRRWCLLPVYHPAAAIGRNFDVAYCRTGRLLTRMICDC